ncbi:MAG: glycosyltransferase N-terminal domain-containing protein [bacterium]
MPGGADDHHGQRPGDGSEEAQGRDRAAHLLPLVDQPQAVKRYLDKLQPDLYITTEAELWPNIQAACRERGVPVCLVNGRLYLHNKQGLRKAILQQLIELCDLIVTQDKTHWLNYIKFAIPPEKLVSSGNIKFDFELEEWGESRMSQERRAIGLGDEPVITAGSTHQGEEELALDCLAQARLDLPRTRLILAPRHVERVDEVMKLIERHKLKALRLSDVQKPGKAKKGKSGGGGGGQREWDVLVVDKYGVLVDMYRFADAVLMGGSYNRKVGGHNILEATVLGKPVVVGPSTFGIMSQMEMLRRDNAVIEADAEHAGARLAALLNDVDARINIGRRAKEVTMRNRGASQRAVDAVLDCYRRVTGDTALEGRRGVAWRELRSGGSGQ